MKTTTNTPVGPAARPDFSELPIDRIPSVVVAAYWRAAAPCRQVEDQQERKKQHLWGK